ncbi:MAG: hypothetical protein AAGD32_18095 [Planctomycetota bacterium]
MRISRSVAVWALLLVNAALLVSLAGRYLGTPEAHAQAAPQGDYLLLPGNVIGVPADVIYVFDTRNGGMIGVAFDENNGSLEALPSIDLNRVFQAAQ